MLLKKILSLVSPVACSLYNLSGVGKGQKKTKCFVVFLEILEFGTGFSRETPLTGAKRHIPSLVEDRLALKNKKPQTQPCRLGFTMHQMRQFYKQYFPNMWS